MSLVPSTFTCFSRAHAHTSGGSRRGTVVGSRIARPLQQPAASTSVEAAPAPAAAAAPASPAKEKKDKAKATGQGAETPKSSAPFQVKDVTMAIPRGMLVAIVGSVGSGKVLSVSHSTLVSSHTHIVEFAARSHRRDAQDQGSRLFWRPRCVLLSNSLDPERYIGTSNTSSVTVY